MDLHAWITQQVDRAEADSRSNLKGLRVAFDPNGSGPVITGIVTGATRTDEGLQLDIARYGTGSIDEAWADVPAIAAALRRCEADRRILARHRLDPDCLAWASCKGCGNDGWGLPSVDNLNACPELLDLAHAHDITDEILAGLDRPQPPEPEPRKHGRLWGVTAPLTTSDVPEALRGPHWKP
jgi:hypothetical protein